MPSRLAIALLALTLCACAEGMDPGESIGVIDLESSLPAGVPPEATILQYEHTFEMGLPPARVFLHWRVVVHEDVRYVVSLHGEALDGTDGFRIGLRDDVITAMADTPLGKAQRLHLLISWAGTGSFKRDRGVKAVVIDGAGDVVVVPSPS